jgi:hypothetical protein
MRPKTTGTEPRSPDESSVPQPQPQRLVTSSFFVLVLQTFHLFASCDEISAVSSLWTIAPVVELVRAWCLRGHATSFSIAISVAVKSG